MVTKSSWGISYVAMLKQIGWLNVRQLVVFQSLVLLFKAKISGKPGYIFDKISGSFQVRTRLADGGIKESTRIKSSLGMQSFMPRSIKEWNSLPIEIRTITKLTKFKSELRTWVKDNFK